MSIVHEALKKADGSQDKDKPASKDARIPSGILMEIRKKRSAVSWGPILIVLVIFFVTGPIIAPVFSSKFGKLSPVTAGVPAGSLAATGGPANAKPQFSMEELPLASAPAIVSTPALPSFNLSGIVYADKDSYCIINNHIVKAGETIGAAKLIRVEPNAVTLSKEGEEIVLRV